MNVLKNLKTSISNPISKDVFVDDSNLQNIMDDINSAIDNYGNELTDISNSNLIDNIEIHIEDVNEEENHTQHTIEDTIEEHDSNSNDCNKYAIIDIISLGKEKMKSKGIQKLRLKRKQRIQRHDNFMIDIYDKIIEENNSVQQSINKLLSCIPPTNLPLYTRQYRISH